VLLLLEAQPVGGGDVGGTLGLGLEPAVDGGAKLRVRAQSRREGDVREPELLGFEQLAQGAQPLELGGPVEAVALGGRAGATSPTRST
jgi:hypothetical protein